MMDPYINNDLKDVESAVSEFAGNSIRIPPKLEDEHGLEELYEKIGNWGS